MVREHSFKPDLAIKYGKKTDSRSVIEAVLAERQRHHQSAELEAAVKLQDWQSREAEQQQQRSVCISAMRCSENHSACITISAEQSDKQLQESCSIVPEWC